MRWRPTPRAWPATRGPRGCGAQPSGYRRAAFHRGRARHPLSDHGTGRWSHPDALIVPGVPGARDRNERRRHRTDLLTGAPRLDPIRHDPRFAALVGSTAWTGSDAERPRCFVHPRSISSIRGFVHNWYRICSPMCVRAPRVLTTPGNTGVVTTPCWRFARSPHGGARAVLVHAAGPADHPRGSLRSAGSSVQFDGTHRSHP